MENPEPIHTTTYTNQETAKIMIDSWEHSPPFIATNDGILVPSVAISTGDSKTLDEFIQTVRYQMEVAKRLKTGVR